MDKKGGIMKNQYAGDVGDYTKLGILRYLENAGFSIGLNWYLTLDEPIHSKTFTDGKHVDFLKCKCDTPDVLLHCALKKIGLSNNRSVTRLENAKLFENALFWNKILEAKNRDEWHLKALKKLGNQDVIFLDPDNGLEVKSTKPYSKNGNKYTTYKEAADYYSQGSTVIIYNHRDRKSESEYVKRFYRFKDIEETKNAKIFYLRASRYSGRDYLFLVQERHFSDLEMAINSFLATEWCRYLKMYLL